MKKVFILALVSLTCSCIKKDKCYTCDANYTYKYAPRLGTDTTFCNEKQKQDYANYGGKEVRCFEKH